jgi:hypothetical protein
MEAEIWKDIQGYVGYYQVSNLGNIRSVERIVSGKNKRKPEGFTRLRRSQLLSPALSNSGYLRVLLCIDGKHKNVTIHREVAKAFVPNPLNKPTVNHRDCNKANNNAKNLDWATRSEQQKHAIANNRYKPPSLKGKKLSAQRIANAVKGRAGYRHSEETKLKISEKAKQRYQ